MSGDTFEFDDRNKAERFVGTLHDPAATVGDVLTVQPDKSIAAQPGGGGSGGVQVVTVPVSSAQVLALDEPVSLAPGVPGKVIVIVGVAVVYMPGVTPYTDNGATLYVSVQSISDEYSTALQGISWAGAGFWDQADARVVGQSYTSFVQASSPKVADFVGQDAVLFADAGNNPTLGDGTLLATLSYFLAPVA